MSDMQLLLRWLDLLARNPKGADDVKSVPGVLPPVQKLVLQLLGQLNMVGEGGIGRAGKGGKTGLQAGGGWLCSTRGLF